MGLNRRMPLMLWLWFRLWLWRWVAAPYDDEHLRCLVFGYRHSVSVIFVCTGTSYFRFYVYGEHIPVDNAPNCST